ncbi:MAG: methyltransferase [Candidatus Dormibacteria bacterium]
MAITQSADPQATIWETTNAIVASRALHVVAELGVADRISEEAQPVSSIAAECGVDPASLDRVLRLLASIGIFARHPDGYAHNDASLLLRSDAPGSMRAFARMMNLRLINETFTELLHSVRSGQPAVSLIEPGGMWSYLGHHPEEARLFGEAMEARAADFIRGVLGAYDFGRFATVADIGGGRGHLLRAIVGAAPSATGILFDLPEVVGTIELRAERLTTIAGDFFRDPLPRADLYILMEVLHDWDDKDCVRILSAVRRAAAFGATLAIVESVVPEAGDDPRINALDVLMLAVTGGRERTAAEFAALFDSSGFRMGTVTPTAGPMKIVEAVAV